MTNVMLNWNSRILYYLIAHSFYCALLPVQTSFTQIVVSKLNQVYPWEDASCNDGPSIKQTINVVTALYTNLELES